MVAITREDGLGSDAVSMPDNPGPAAVLLLKTCAVAWVAPFWRFPGRAAAKPVFPLHSQTGLLIPLGSGPMNALRHHARLADQGEVSSS